MAVFGVFAILVLLPIAAMLSSSLFVDGGLSLTAYKGLLGDKRQLGLFGRSILLGGATALFSILLGAPYAFIVSRTNTPFRGFFRSAYLFPLLIPPYMHAIVWMHLTLPAPDGPIAASFSLDDVPFSIYNVWGCVLILTLSLFPYTVLLTAAGLNAMGREFEEAGKLVRGRPSVAFGITLPLIRPYILTGMLIVFVFAITNYGVPGLLDVNVYPVEVFAQFSAFYDEGAAAATATPLVLTTLILILCMRLQMGGRVFVSVGDRGEGERAAELGGWRWVAASFCALVILASVVAPVTVLTVKSKSPSVYMKAFGLAHGQIVRSFLLALSGATLITALGFAVAYLIERSRGAASWLAELTADIPLAIPATVLGIGLIKVWNRPMTEAIYLSPLIIIIGYCGRFAPFAVKAISANLKQLDPAIEEAAALSARSWARRAINVLLPLSLPGVKAAWIITFILCMGELGTTLLISPAGEATVPIRIYNVMHYGAYQLVAALCLILVALTAAPVLLISLVRPKWRRVGKDHA